MIHIKNLTIQEYEKNKKSPSEIVFYNSEKDLINIIGLHISDNFKESIEVTEKFLSLPSEAEVYEIKKNIKILYVIKVK